jgi:hypothetical protein
MHPGDTSEPAGADLKNAHPIGLIFREPPQTTQACGIHSARVPVSGFTTSGSTGNAVVGQSQGTGAGVVGESPAGTGVVASGKTALKVTGPAVFSRSGILTIKAGQSSVKKTGIALTPASFVLATIQGNVAGVHVQGVTLVTGSPGSFTIHLNKTVSKSMKVAWFAVN